MLVELAVGDAYGAGFEFRNTLYVRAFNRVDRHRRPALALSGGGRYTDDTQMTIAITEAILTEDPWTPELIAAHFVCAFQRDPRTGYAPGFHRFLRSVSNAEDFLTRIRPTSDRSGAAMRAGPVGLHPDIATVLERAEIQARVTHDTEAGVASAQAAALMVHHFARRDGTPGDLADFASEHVRGPWREPWRGKVSMRGMDCVHAAITATAQTSSLKQLLHRCVAFGGDVDTVATIALAAASWSPHHAPDLPESLIEGLERSEFGYDYLRTLDQHLIDHMKLETR